MTHFAKRPADTRYSASRPATSNKFALIADPLAEGSRFVAAIEIFDVGGETPPNAHRAADELFYVLHGEGVAVCNGARILIKQGDSFFVRAGAEHVVRNIGACRLYCLTTMVPDENFAPSSAQACPPPSTTKTCVCSAHDAHA